MYIQKIHVFGPNIYMCETKNICLFTAAQCRQEVKNVFKIRANNLYASGFSMIAEDYSESYTYSYTVLLDLLHFDEPVADVEAEAAAAVPLLAALLVLTLLLTS